MYGSVMKVHPVPKVAQFSKEENIMPAKYKPPPRLPAPHLKLPRTHWPPYRPRYGEPKDFKRPLGQTMPKKNKFADMLASNLIRMQDINPREIKHPPMVIGNNEHDIYSNEAYKLSSHNYRDYRRDGQRMTYEMWPRSVEQHKYMDIAPERFDTYVNLESEHYRKMHKMRRKLWKLDDRIGAHRTTELPKRMDTAVGPGDSAKPRERHVEIEDELHPVPPKIDPDASGEVRMKQLWDAMLSVRDNRPLIKPPQDPNNPFPPCKKGSTYVEYDDKWGAPEPPVVVPDPSPAPSKPQVYREVIPRVHPQEFKENRELRNLYNQLTDEERQNLKDNCTNMMGFKPEWITDWTMDEAYVLRILWDARRQAIRAGFCPNHSNYWDISSWKHYVDWRKFAEFYRKGQLEKINANREYDYQLTRGSNTEACVDYNFPPFTVTFPKDDLFAKSGANKKMESKPVERKKKNYKYVVNKPSPLRSQEGEDLVESNTTYHEEFPWKTNGNKKSVLNKAYFSRRPYWDWNYEVPDDLIDPSQVFHRSNNVDNGRMLDRFKVEREIRTNNRDRFDKYDQLKPNYKPSTAKVYINQKKEGITV